jgi:murein L,D-transpeptidase YcbB/YkuD
LLAAASAAPQRAAGPQPEAGSPPPPGAIAAIVRAARHPELRWPDFARQRAALDALYAARAWAPLWLAGARPTPQAEAALDALARAADHALDPADYDAARLADWRRALAEGPPAPAERLVLFEVGLTVDVLRFATHLHVGRLEPAGLTFGFDAPPHRVDLVRRLPEAVAAGRLRELLSELEPDDVMYGRLLHALAEYRALAADPAVRPPALAALGVPGEPAEGLGALARYLTALRDLPADAWRDDGRYAGAVVEAVRRFQLRHGLEPDGVLGSATRGALAVEPARRVRQIELTLERLRWIPDLPPARFVIVNIPAFELVARDSLTLPGESALAMRVVVGRAGRTPTPVFVAALRELVFGPWWNVPRSIALGEMLPKIRRDSGWLARQALEIVTSGDARPLDATPENVERLAAGTASLRQRPGPGNALGRVKFLFPNRYSVYLHDTPAQEIFRRSRRDFSHGCVRVEDPLGLAAWVLRGRPEWDRAAIERALASAHDLRVAVTDPVLVMIFYATVIVRSDGGVRFFDDLYGHDAQLARALAQGPR